MKLTAIRTLVNNQLAGERLSYEQLVPYLDQVIDEINNEVNAVFPAFSELPQEATDYDAFHDRFIRDVVCIGAAYYFYIMDEEGAAAANEYKEKYYNNLFIMVRDYMDQIQEEYQATGENLYKVGSPGLSAYEVWLQLPGNEGKSVFEFIASLTGPQGPQGPPGEGLPVVSGVNWSNMHDLDLFPLGPSIAYIRETDSGDIYDAIEFVLKFDSNHAVQFDIQFEAHQESSEAPFEDQRMDMSFRHTSVGAFDSENSDWIKYEDILLDFVQNNLFTPSGHTVELQGTSTDGSYTYTSNGNHCLRQVVGGTRHYNIIIEIDSVLSAGAGDAVISNINTNNEYVTAIGQAIWENITLNAGECIVPVIRPNEAIIRLLVRTSTGAFNPLPVTAFLAGSKIEISITMLDTHFNGMF